MKLIKKRHIMMTLAVLEHDKITCWEGTRLSNYILALDKLIKQIDMFIYIF